MRQFAEASLENNIEVVRVTEGYWKRHDYWTWRRIKGIVRTENGKKRYFLSK